MILFRLIKGVCLLVGIVAASNIGAMQLATYKDSPDKFVRELPFMTLARAYYRYNDCNDLKAQKDIKQKISDKNDECFSMAFNIATKIPVDNHAAVANYLFNNNKVVVKKFLRTPLKELSEVLELYAWTQDVYDGKKAQHFMQAIGSSNQLTIDHIKKEMFDRGDLFQYSNEIQQVDSSLAERKQDCCIKADRNTLEALEILNKKIKEICKEIGGGQNAGLNVYEGRVGYFHYDSYTWKNFLNELKNRNGVLACYGLFEVAMVTTWLSRSIIISYFFGGGLLLMMLSCLRKDDFPVGFLGVFGGVSAGFLGLACIRTLIKMRSSQCSFVELKDIPEVLEKCRIGHIIIE